MKSAVAPNAIKAAMSKMMAHSWVFLLRSAFTMGLVRRRQVQGFGFERMYLIFWTSFSLKISTFASKMSRAVLPSSLTMSLLEPAKRSSLEMFFNISKASRSSALYSSSSSSYVCFSLRLDLTWIICKMQRCKLVFPSASWEFGFAPSFRSACTFWMSKLIQAVCKAVAPFSSTALTSISCVRLKMKIERTPSYLYAAQWMTVMPVLVLSLGSAK